MLILVFLYFKYICKNQLFGYIWICLKCYVWHVRIQLSEHVSIKILYWNVFVCWFIYIRVLPAGLLYNHLEVSALYKTKPWKLKQMAYFSVIFVIKAKSVDKIKVLDRYITASWFLKWFRNLERSSAKNTIRSKNVKHAVFI